MARIRSIKPEFWTSGQVLECSTNARLMFIGLWNFADDEGRHPYRPKQIKAQIFPSDDFTEKDILGMLLELSKNTLITTYTIDNEQYFTINGWHHQRIDKPQPAKYPPPLLDDSGNVLGTIPPDRIGEDRIGEDTKGKEGKGEDNPIFVLPEWIDSDLWTEWMKIRKKLKAVNSPRAMELLVDKLFKISQSGISVNTAIKTAIEKSWKSIELDWLFDKKKGKPDVYAQFLEGFKNEII